MKEKCWDGCDRLGINSVLGASSIVGLMPLHFADKHHNAHQSTSFAHFGRRFGFQCGLDDGNRVLTLLATHMLKNGKPGSKRISEHAMCKALRKITIC